MTATCRHLNRSTLGYCGAYADFVLDSTLTGIPVCRKHLGSLVLAAMGADGGSLPCRSVTVVPADHWTPAATWHPTPTS